MWASIRVLVLLVVVAFFTGQGIAADSSSASSSSSTSSSAAAAAAEALAQLPSCALKCLIAAVGESSCSATDVECQCADATFVSTAEMCVMMSCTIEESLSKSRLEGLYTPNLGDEEIRGHEKKIIMEKGEKK